MLAFSFIWSTIFLACVLAASWSRNRTPIVLGLGAAGFFVPPLCMFVSMATSLHIVFVCAAACVCAVTKARLRAYQLAVVAATMAAYGVTAMFAVGEARHVQALARTNAFESLTPLLAYEVDRQTASKQADTVYATNTMSARWDNFEGELGSHWAPRQIALEQLHAGTVNRFIASPAFGVGRMTHMADDALARSRQRSSVAAAALRTAQRRQPRAGRRRRARPRRFGFTSAVDRSCAKSIRLLGPSQKQLERLSRARPLRACAQPRSSGGIPVAPILGGSRRPSRRHAAASGSIGAGESA